MNMSALSKNGSKSLLDKLKANKTLSGKNSYSDERIWKPSKDGDGNGMALLRLMPPTSETAEPFVEISSHGFKDKGGWYIEECPKSIDKPCPACELAGRYFSTGLESDKAIGRKYYKRKRYYVNVLVIDDKLSPENNGKVFLWGMPTKILQKIEELINPPETFGEEPLNPFSFFDGVNLKLRISQNAGGFPNYDNSTFERAADLFDGDEEKLKALLEKCYNLEDYRNEVCLTDYNELKRKLNRAIGLETTEANPADNVKVYNAPTQKNEDDISIPAKVEPNVATATSDETDELLNYFQNLKKA